MAKKQSKDSIRYFKEKVIKCVSCKHLFAGRCEKHNVPMHKNEVACAYIDKITN